MWTIFFCTKPYSPFDAGLAVGRSFWITAYKNCTYFQWGLNNIASILPATLPDAFYWMVIIIFDSHFIKIFQTDNKWFWFQARRQLLIPGDPNWHGLRCGYGHFYIKSVEMHFATELPQNIIWWGLAHGQSMLARWLDLCRRKSRWPTDRRIDGACHYSDVTMSILAS